MRKGEATKARVIREAATVFNQKGFAATSLQDLLDATGLQKGGLYRHFESKEALAQEAYAYAWFMAKAARSGDVDAALPAVDQLFAYLDGFARPQEALPAGGCPFLNAAIEFSDADGESPLRVFAENALSDWSNRLQMVITTGIARREIKADCDPEALALLIIGTLEGALIISRLQRRTQPLIAAAEMLKTLLNQYRI